MILSRASKQYLLIYFSLLIIAVGAFFAIRIYLPLPVKSTPPSITSCDIDGNQFCDFNDLQIIYSAMGSCVGEAEYRPDFDTDGDGCLTEAKDLEKLKNIYYSLLDTSKIPTPASAEYDENCDFDRDLDCDDQDTIRYHAILDERAKVQTIVGGLVGYSVNHEEYPDTLEMLVPSFISEVPVLPNVNYRVLKGRREYQLCYTSLEKGSPATVCLPN